MGLFGKIDEYLTEVQAESAENISIDLRLREGASLLIASCINKIVPTQQSPQPLQNITHDAVNLLMTDYQGNLQNNQIFATIIPSPPEGGGGPQKAYHFRRGWTTKGLSF